jgi:serine protease
MMRATRAWLFCLTAALGLPAPLSIAQAERGPRESLPVAAMGEARVIVKYKELQLDPRARSAGATGSRAAQRAQALGGRLGLELADGRLVGARTQVIHARSIDSTTLANRLAAQDDVQWAVVDRRAFPSAVIPNDPLYADSQIGTTPVAGQWYLRAPTATLVSAVDAPGAWAVTLGSPGVVVAVLDTGVRMDHPDLAANVVPGYDFIGDLPYANDGDGRDADASDPGDWITATENAGGTFVNCGERHSGWHGTQVAGIVGAVTDNGVGMASLGRQVRVQPVRVLGKCGGWDSDIQAAMRWAAGIAIEGVALNATPAQVLNLSLGGPANVACSQAYRDAVDEVLARGVTVIAAAGNGGNNVQPPANCPGVIAVAALRHAGNKVGYSNFGPEVSLSAPGGNCVNEFNDGNCVYPIVSTSDVGKKAPMGPTYTTGGDDAGLGTSFSAPLVSATAALMRSANPALTPAQIRSLLETTARPFASPGEGGAQVCGQPSGHQLPCDCTATTCGAGMLDAGAAVRAAGANNTNVPTATISAARFSLTLGESLGLDGRDSAAAGALSLATYQWSITDGAAVAKIDGNATGPIATLKSLGVGTVSVRLAVTDSASHVGVATRVFTVGSGAPSAVVQSMATRVEAGKTLLLDGRESTAIDGRTLVGYEWTFIEGAERAAFDGAVDGPTAALRGYVAGAVKVQLRVTDSMGQSGMTEHRIVVVDLAPTPAVSAVPDVAQVGGTLSLDAGGSTAAAGRSIAGYGWEIVSGASLARFKTDRDLGVVTLELLAPGELTVKVTVIDDTGVDASSNHVFTIAPAAAPAGEGSGGGGGAWQPWWSLGLFAAILALLQPAACASGGPASGGLRVQVRVTDAHLVDAAAVAAAAQQIAGVPVRDALASGLRWYALTLVCDNAAECEVARLRLTAQPQVFDPVEVDRRATVPQRPTPAGSR